MISLLHFIICASQKKLTSRYPVEAGHFSDKERVIPECPIKKTPFGFRQVLSDEKSFSKVLNSYIKVNRMNIVPHAVVLNDSLSISGTSCSSTKND